MTETEKLLLRECWQQVDDLRAIIRNREAIVSEAQTIVSTAVHALALAGLLEDIEDSGLDIDVGLMIGVGAVIEVQDPESGDRWEYASKQLHEAVIACRADLDERRAV